ncbi:MAG: accessory factor UbiK family protein [Burkholderiaceae bacterium]
MQNSAFFENMQERISKLLDETPVADLRKNLRAVLQQGFEHFDLATREQLDLQTELLARAQDKIAELEMRISALEGTGAHPSELQDPPLG